MSLGQAIGSCFRKYATFSGRATRSEFWWFTLSVTVFNIVLGTAGTAASFALESMLPFIGTYVIALALMIPGLAVTWRRLHDTGRSGWWMLLMFTGVGIFVLFIWFLQKSQPEDNKYGPPEFGIKRLAETFD